MSLTDLIKRRKNIVNQESEGINLAIYLINEFKDRTFTFKGLKNKYFGIRGEELLKLIQEELDSIIVVYSYTINQESEGINLTIYLVNEFKDRTFTFKGLKNKYFGIRGEELLKLIQEELDSMIVVYSYTTRVKTYTDRKGVSQVKIRLIGKAGTMDRYNPLDITLDITTETPQA